MKKIKLLDKTFVPFISHAELMEATDRVAEQVKADFSDRNDVPILLCVLNGSISFTAELMKRLDFELQLVSTKYTSYLGTSSTGNVTQAIGFTTDVRGRRILIVEDIIDSGDTVAAVKAKLLAEGAAEVKICTMLFKPDAFKNDYKIDYIGINIPNKFIVGFGLDYKELGRNLNDIYVLDGE